MQRNLKPIGDAGLIQVNKVAQSRVGASHGDPVKRDG
jgi:hypothetical protein